MEFVASVTLQRIMLFGSFVAHADQRRQYVGVWGAAIFSDETACDVRDEWREYVGDGLSGPDATDKLLADWSDSLTDPDDGPVFWLALAATQSKAGRLEERVKSKALAIIDDESNLTRWREDGALLRKRKAVLAKLHEQLLSAQPPAKKIRKTVKAVCDWEIGDVIAYRLRSGKFVLFRVLNKVSDKGGTYPECQFYDWIGTAVPSQDQVQGLSIKPGIVMMCGSTMRSYPADRLKETGIRLPAPSVSSPMGVGVWPWNKIDERLAVRWNMT